MMGETCVDGVLAEGKLGHVYSITGKFLDWQVLHRTVLLAATPFYLPASTANIGSATGNTESVPRFF
jgi:hypothetical protein